MHKRHSFAPPKGGPKFDKVAGHTLVKASAAATGGQHTLMEDN